MTKYEYIPIDYFSYNRPEYFAAIIVMLMFTLFIIILYLVFKYEYYKRLDYCDSMFYYGKPCVNKYSKSIIMDPKFVEMKRTYYDIVSQYNDKTGKYEGVRESTGKNKKSIDKAEENIEDNLKRNEEFNKNSIEEIQKISTISKLIASKYLGNMEDILRNIHSAPDYVLESIKGLPEQLGLLRIQIQDTLVNPLFKQYTAPLQKLYRSLTELDKKTVPYIKKDK